MALVGSHQALLQLNAFSSSFSLLRCVAVATVATVPLLVVVVAAVVDVAAIFQRVFPHYSSRTLLSCAPKSTPPQVALL